MSRYTTAGHFTEMAETSALPSPGKPRARLSEFERGLSVRLMDTSCRAFFCFVSALLGIDSAVGPARALEGSKLFATGPNPLVVKIEGRKGTRLYRPDPDEPATAAKWEAEHSEQTAKTKLDDCMVSWDAKTYIAKSNWRQICEREIKNNE